MAHAAADTSFDVIAERYDADFSYSEIGSRLRALVWQYTDKYLSGKQLNILEINCGTGEDAIHFAEKGHTVTATDVSAGMIKIAQSKSQGTNPGFRQLSYDEIKQAFPENSFDVVFSDFGGLNCADETMLKNTLASLHCVLKPGGMCIAVIMGTACIWERLYFISKLQFGDAFRRNRKRGADTVFENKNFKTWYYSPASIRKYTKGLFNCIELKPVGLFIPPTYMEGHFSKHINRLNKLAKLERRFAERTMFANYADHYMIVLKK